MPRRRSTIPQMRLHKPKGRAVVYIDRRPVYLGAWGSPEAVEAYGKLIAKLAQGHSVEAARSNDAPAALKVSDLLLRYVLEDLPRFHPDEQHCQKGAIRILRQLFGETPIESKIPGEGFGPLKLRIVRDAMVAGDPEAVDAEGKPSPRKPWSREYVNHQIRRLRSIFRWGVSLEIVSQTTSDALASLAPLRAGATTAVDYEPREAVPAEDIEAVRKLLKPRDQDILDLMLLTGARPGELIGLKVGQIDRRGDTWRCDLKKHKTAHKGKKRVLFFNRKAQAILLRHMKADSEARIFITTRSTFSNTIKEKCLAAGVTHFVPHQLRHTVGTNLADEMGTEAVQRVLGHASKAMAEHYSRAAEKKACEAVQRLGGD